MPTPTREGVKEAVAAYMRGVAERDIELLTDLLAPEVVLELPSAPDGIPRRVDGRDGVLALLGGVSGWLEPMKFSDVTVDTLHDAPDWAIVQFRAESRVVSTGEAYRNRYVALMQISDGRVVHRIEFFDPVALLRVRPESLG